MSETARRLTGGCLCGGLRYEAQGEPIFAGYCCCADCRKASGSGFIPFMGFAAGAVSFSGPARQFRSPSLRGVAVRNSCPTSGGLVFGGVIGESDQHTIYAGTLDDPSAFEPRMAIFQRDKPDWVMLPTGLTAFETLPTGPRPT